MIAYIVMGQTGEYSDGREWIVKGFLNEDSAKELVLNAEKRANEIYSKATNGGLNCHDYHRTTEVNEYDASMQMDYTGTSYYYEECEIEE